MKFFLVGLLVAGLEEFITQGVLKNRPFAWIAPTVIAFTPFLAIMRAMAWLLGRHLKPRRAVVAYYVAAGLIGLAFEWFVMGLAPRGGLGLVQVTFQAGMFGFWAGVAMVPLILLDGRQETAEARRTLVWMLALGFAVAYGLTFAANDEHRFVVAISAVILMFLGLNVPYIRYWFACGANSVRRDSTRTPSIEPTLNRA